eukprot:scpid25033/ scgid12646/ 
MPVNAIGRMNRIRLLTEGSFCELELDFETMRQKSDDSNSTYYSLKIVEFSQLRGELLRDIYLFIFAPRSISRQPIELQRDVHATNVSHVFFQPTWYRTVELVHGGG